MSPEKRKKITRLTNQQKAEIYQKMERGTSRAQLCTDYDIATRTITKIMQDGAYNPKKQVINPELKRLGSKSSHIFKKELLNWYLEREITETTTSYKQLRERAKEIKKGNRWGPSNFSDFLRNFEKEYNIQLVFSVRTSLEHVEVDEQLLNWLLERMIDKGRISKEMLKDKTEELMKKSGVPLNTQNDKNKVYSWRMRFEDCHNILIESDIFNELIEGDVETNQSDKNLDEQLLDWLLWRKRSGETISHEILTRKAQELLDNFGGSIELGKGNWLYRILKRYLGSYQKFPQVIVENVTEEHIAVEGVH